MYYEKELPNWQLFTFSKKIAEVFYYNKTYLHWQMHDKTLPMFEAVKIFESR